MGALTLDPIGHLRTHLLAELEPDNDADIATKIRPDWTGGRFVRLGLVGGAVFTFTNDQGVDCATADVSVQVYGESETDASEYAGLAFDAVLTLTHGTGIRIQSVRCISAPAAVPDTTRTDPYDRVVMTFAVTYHSP